MKITRKELLKLINEERVQMEESVLLEAPNSLTSPAVQRYEQDPDGYEGDMARKSLYHMARQADQLHGMLRGDENLEPWVQAKITKAADYLEAAFKSITYDKDNPKGH
jgi:hypothetical protein|tara:strand:+ start:603 stop:926 length:324 start_codon:yes stop_codon:yes gene_type:complete